MCMLLYVGEGSSSAQAAFLCVPKQGTLLVPLFEDHIEPLVLYGVFLTHCCTLKNIIG